MGAEKEIDHLLDQLCSLRNRKQDLKTIKSSFVLTMTSGRPDLDEDTTDKIFIRMFETYDEANNKVKELEKPTMEMHLKTRTIFDVGNSIIEEKVIFLSKKRLFAEMMQEIGTNPGAKLSVEIQTGLAARNLLKEVTPN
jgi:hypothetical protein